MQRWRTDHILPVSEEENVLLTGALWHGIAWTEMSFSMTFTLMGVLTGDSVRTRLYHQGHANTQQKILEGEKILEGAAPWGPAVVTGQGWVLRFIPSQFFYHVGKSGAGSLNWSKNSEKLEFSCEWWVPDLRQGSYFGKVIPWHKQKQYTNKCVFHSPCLPNAQLHCNRKVSAASIKTKLPFILFFLIYFET